MAESLSLDRNKIILIAGSGRLPVVIAERLRVADAPLTVLSLPGSGQTWPAEIPSATIALDNCMEVLAHKRATGWTHVVMAGGVSRPTTGREQSPTLPIDFSGGDDAVLRQFITRMEDDLGLCVVGAADIAPELVTHQGCLTATAPSCTDRADIEQGFRRARQHGMNDAGQAAVVAHGHCIALELPAGTDALLRKIARDRDGSDGSAGRRGVLAKCKKPIQDQRIDLPTIGPHTVEMAANAGLAGIAIESGAVILLDRDETLEIANRHGLFIWSGEITS